MRRRARDRRIQERRIRNGAPSAQPQRGGARRSPPSPGGCSGLQASGLPSGAQQVPVTALPWRPVKLQAVPAALDSHATNASRGGPRCSPPFAGCAAAAPIAPASKAATHQILRQPIQNLFTACIAMSPYWVWHQCASRPWSQRGGFAVKLRSCGHWAPPLQRPFSPTALRCESAQTRSGRAAETSPKARWARTLSRQTKRTCWGEFGPCPIALAVTAEIWRRSSSLAAYSGRPSIRSTG